MNKTKSFLKENENLIKLTTDKLNKTVMRTENEYEQKMNSILEDHSIYEELTKTYTKRD